VVKIIIFYLVVILLNPTVVIAKDSANHNEVRASLSEREEKLQKAKEDLARLEASLIVKQNDASSSQPENISNLAKFSASNSILALTKSDEVDVKSTRNADKKIADQQETKSTSSEISVPVPVITDNPQNNLADVAEIAQLKERLVGLENKQKNLTDELKKAHSDLLIAETEVERLSALLNQKNELVLSRVDKKNRYNDSKVHNKSGKVEDKLFSTNLKRSEFSKLNNSIANQPVAEQVDAPGEMPIATVIVTKAHLRTGPGKDHSPLLSVSEGTRLAVETREGEWYRVITPTGARAWVAGEVIKFGNKASIAAVREPSIKPPSLDDDDADADKRAFQHLRNHAQSKVVSSE
jgi:hypothetical protein